MNWKNKIVSILGKFWSSMFGDRDFILAIENLSAIFCLAQHSQLVYWKNDRIQKKKKFPQGILPYVIDIDASSVHRKFASIKDITEGKKVFGYSSEYNCFSDDEEWMTEDVSGLVCPAWITNHTFRFDRVYLDSIDYKLEDGRLVFFKDPRSLGFQILKKTTDSGELKLYYRMFGWRLVNKHENDAVSGFISQRLANTADAAWDVHVNGASVLNTKKLIAGVSKNVVSYTDGIVKDIWVEQDKKYVLVDSSIYSADSSVQCNVVPGKQVYAGDVLFGDLKVYSDSQQPPSTVLPGIRVMTDAGELTAPNREITITAASKFHDPITGYNYLPLEGDESVVDSYIARCKKIAADPKSLFCTIPSVVNPCVFVRSTLRRRRGCMLTLSADGLLDLEAALSCIRENTSASSVVTVFIRATGELITAAVKGFTAEAGNAAVSEYTTISLRNTEAVSSRLI